MTTQTIDHKLLEELEFKKHFVGNTPLYPIRNIFRKDGVQLFAKLEWQQLGASVKSRPAFNIIKQAVEEGQLNSNKTLLDASSGNTGIAYAAIGASLGIPVTICLPENASEERKTILKAYNANVILTSPFGGTDEAQQVARELASERPDKYYYADQYNNENNWKAHYNGTAEEIYEQTIGSVTHFVAGLGTTGTFTGTGRKLKEHNEDIKLISLQPDSSMHGLEGWKHLETARVPGIFDHSLSEENLDIDTYDAIDMIKEAAKAEGLFLSPSAAANLLGAVKVAEKIDEGVIVTVFADSADKYNDINNSIF